MTADFFFFFFFFLHAAAATVPFFPPYPRGERGRERERAKKVFALRKFA